MRYPALVWSSMVIGQLVARFSVGHSRGRYATSPVLRIPLVPLTDLPGDGLPTTGQPNWATVLLHPSGKSTQRRRKGPRRMVMPLCIPPMHADEIEGLPAANGPRGNALYCIPLRPRPYRSRSVLPVPPAVDKPEAAANGSAPAAFQDMGNIRPWVQHKGAKQQEQKQRQQQQPPQVKQQPGGPSTESIAINTPDTPKDPGPGPEEESGYVDHDGDIFYDAPSRFEGDLVHPDVRYLVQNEAIQAMIGGTSADVTAAANRNHASAQSTLSRVSNGIVRALRAARILGKTVPLPPVTIPIGRRMVVLGEDIHGLETPEALSQYLKDVELEQRQQRRPGPVDMRTALNRMYAEERLRGRGAHQNQQMRLMNALRTEKGAPIPEECLPPVQCKDVENVSSED